jgi:hypothetical protein
MNMYYRFFLALLAPGVIAAAVIIGQLYASSSSQIEASRYFCVLRV